MTRSSNTRPNLPSVSDDTWALMVLDARPHSRSHQNWHDVARIGAKKLLRLWDEARDLRERAEAAERERDELRRALDASGSEPPSGIEGALQDVLAFAEATGDCLVANRDPHPPGLTRRLTRLRLLREEVRELEDATDANDLEEVADAYADIVYIVLGSAIAHFGVERFARVWREVQRANMAKFVNGVKMRPDGKILKPEGWTPPDIAGALRGRKGERP